MSPDVVLLESDAAERERYLAALRALGYEATAAESAAAARTLLAEADGALLIANLMLAEGPCFELAAEWRAEGRRLLALSDAFRGPTALQILRERLGLDLLVEAPIADDELAEHVAALLGPRAGDTDPNLTAAGAEVTAETAMATATPAALDPFRVPLTGTFEEAEIAAVLARLALERVDGALMLQSDRVKKLVFFEAGAPVGLKSNLIQECLGQLLVAEGRLSPEACEESLEEMHRTNRRQGEILVAMGHLAADELDAAVRRQFWVKFRQLFTWNTGAYRFRDTTVPPTYRLDPGLDAANLLWRALDEEHPLERARAVLQPVHDTLVVLAEGGLDISALQVDADVHPLFAGLDGTRTAAQALASTPDPARAELLLYALTAFGAVTYVSADPSPRG